MKPEDQFSDIEDKLRGLVPPAVSEHGQQRFEETIDQLAGVDVSQIPHSRMKKWGMAAAVVGSVSLAWSLTYLNRQNTSDDVSLVLGGDAVSDSNMILLTSTNRVDHRQDDGLIVPADGSAPHYRYRYQVTDEERVKDPETGTIITLRQPREEIITVPVTQF